MEAINSLGVDLVLIPGDLTQDAIPEQLAQVEGCLMLLDAPSHVHLAYRPGVPLVRRVWLGGRAH